MRTLQTRTRSSGPRSTEAAETPRRRTDAGAASTDSTDSRFGAFARARRLRRARRRAEPRPEDAHEPPHRTTAFVLSGGGHLGAVQIGQLQALFERGIEPDVYVACSVGALNASVMASVPGLAGVEHLKETWRRLSAEDLFPASSVGQAWAIARRQNHLHPNDGVIRVVTSAVPATHFHHLRVRLRIVTTLLSTGEERVFAAGQLMRPLLASTALPGLLPPVSINGNLYVDGGVVNNVPISHVAGADRVFVLAVNDGTTESVPNTTWGMLMRGYAISRSVRFRIDVQRYSEQTDLVVLPVPTDIDVRFPDLSRTLELADMGYEAASKFLDGQEWASGTREGLGPWIPTFDASNDAMEAHAARSRTGDADAEPAPTEPARGSEAALDHADEDAGAQGTTDDGSAIANPS